LLKKIFIFSTAKKKASLKKFFSLVQIQPILFILYKAKGLKIQRPNQNKKER
jgi:hypothetical protein